MKTNDLTWIGVALIGAAVLLAVSRDSQGADGEIVVVRSVPPRIAYRNTTPGPVESRVQTSPRSQVQEAISGTGGAIELSDRDIAGFHVSQTASQHESQTMESTLASGFTAPRAGGTVAPMLSSIGGSGASAVSQLGETTQGVGRTVIGITLTLPLGVAK